MDDDDTTSLTLLDLIVETPPDFIPLTITPSSTDAEVTKDDLQFYAAALIAIRNSWRKAKTIDQVVKLARETNNLLACRRRILQKPYGSPRSLQGRNIYDFSDEQDGIEADSSIAFKSNF